MFQVPANVVNPFDLLGNSIKQIIHAAIQLISAVVNTSVTASSAASQSSSDGSKKNHHVSYPGILEYGPPQQTYGSPHFNQI